MATSITSAYTALKLISGTVDGRPTTLVIKPGHQVFQEDITNILPDNNLIVTLISAPLHPRR